MDTPMMLTISQVRRSQSGKSLSCLAHDDRWYQSKCWDFENMAAPFTIYAQTSENEWQGKPMYWINDYSLPEQALPQQTHVPAPPPTAPAPQDPALAQGTRERTVPVAPVPQAVDRDASIVAQTLCKTVTFTSMKDAWTAYITTYQLYLDWAKNPWRHERTIAEGHEREIADANEQLQYAGHEPPFSDDIPF